MTILARGVKPAEITWVPAEQEFLDKLPDYDQPAPQGPPDVTPAKMLPGRLKKTMKRIARARRTGVDDWAYVRCEGCGWVGFDEHHYVPKVRDIDGVRSIGVMTYNGQPHLVTEDPLCTPCPKCGGLTAVPAFDY